MKMKVIIYAYPPISIGLNAKTIHDNCIVIVPLGMKNFYTEFNQKNMRYVRNFDYQSIISETNKIVEKNPVEEFIVLSEPDIEFGGFLNDTYGKGIAIQGLSNAMLYRNKYYMRSMLEKKVKQPEFYKVEKKEMITDIIDKRGGEWILKPLAKDSAEGIKRIKNKEDIEKLNIDGDVCLLEEMVEHKTMFTTDGICSGENIVEFFIHQYDQPILETFNKSKRHITRTHSLDLDINIKRKLFESTATILKTFNQHGEIFPFHMEWFLKEGDVIFCEVASRFGGKIGTLIQMCYDFNIFDKYWNIKLNNKDIMPIDFYKIRNPSKITFNYSAYRHTGKLKFIPKIINSNVFLKVRLNQNYMVSSNIQESAFELYDTYKSENDYMEAIKRLDDFNTKFVYE